MRYLLLFLLAIVTCLFPEPSHADEMVTVKLLNHIGETDSLSIEVNGDYFNLHPTVNVKSGETYTLKVKNDNTLVLKGGGDSYTINDSFVLYPKRYSEDHQIYVNERPYLGAMEFVIEEKKYIRPINQLPLEDYLKGVVPLEVFPSWELETLKAQTLAARTYAVSHVDKLIDDTIQYQVYGGYEWDETTTQAVEETKGEVITYDDELINAFYSASNGGKTESNENVWGGESKPYFPVKEDPFDPTHPWEFSLHKTQIDLDEINWDDPFWWIMENEQDPEITETMKSWLQKNGYPGEIKILSIPHFSLSEEKLASGRSVQGSITIEFLRRLMEGTILFQQVKLDDVPLNQIRPMIGGNSFKSYLLDSLEADEEKYTLSGRGFGHGVGMSQWGAQVMGENGKNYKEIIQFYYPGTEIKDLNRK
ncbi:SpoIID/LytB domain-containing protein [Oceanobacillus halotolerans]|uniref:SpoIID/LytB domain-containing protein n=1 Tax=Oceanobacillus halotolerans TaxID=2663380 RepID=UPI0013DD2C0C|nr:SpoIID/LytB domain-containing protein [Oceanobacillus halotolerans]